LTGSSSRFSKNINDGFFEIKYDSDGVYLVVHPPIADGRKVAVNDVIERLNKKQVKNYDKNVVETAVVKANKIPVKIAEPQDEEKINAEASVMVSPDKMKAFLVLAPPEGGRMLHKDEIINVLSQNGVISGINSELIDAIIKKPVYNEMVCVAEGTLPVNGKNGSVEYHFDIKKDRKPAILEDGRVDFRELNLIESVSKGQKLCSLIPPQPGISGKNVEGADLPALDGKPAVLPKGKNVEITEDGQFLVAGIDGQVNYSNGKVSVYATYEVPGDVDNSTGNINFVGNINVRGNVLSGFSIEAGGNVEVWGVVEGAFISAGGNIILRRGMQGLGKGVLKSGGDIFARYIENSNIEAKNNIRAEAIMHSNIKCGNKLELGGKKGLLVGGTCRVGKEIDAKTIGSYMATATDIEVGVDPGLRDRYKELKEEIVSLESDIKKANQIINLLNKLQSAGTLTPEKQELLSKSIRTKLYYSNRLNELKEELMTIEVSLRQEAFGKVHVRNYIYPGTKVSIGSSSMYVKENLQYCTLYREGSDIKIGSINK
jgi:uncharacterized protein (DUF342 family)